MKFKFNDMKELAYTWLNNGQLPSGEPDDRIEISDAIETTNASMWLPKIMQNIVKEAVEPLLMGTSLLQRVEYHAGATITFPAVGALEAADIADGQSFPERQLQMGGATVTANIGKSGIAVAITEEMIRYSQYDIVNMHLRAAGRALARHKEKKIFNFINAMGSVCFDNLNPTSSMHGVTTGRALDGTGNGSATADDLFDAYASILIQGFTPDTLLMHPLAWTMFMKDPVMRLIMLNSGGGTWFGTYQGNPSGRAPWDNSSQNRLGVSGGQNVIPGGNAGSQTATPLTGYPQTINSAPRLPSYFSVPFRILVSPFVPFNPSTKLTSIAMFDSSELGALIVDQDVTTDEWTDPAVDIHKIKMKERYGFGIFHEGMSIGLLRNVKVTPNRVVFPAQVTQSVSTTLSELSPTTAVV